VRDSIDAVWLAVSVSEKLIGLGSMKLMIEY
jgi:hypothetical protein